MVKFSLKTTHNSIANVGKLLLIFIIGFALLGQSAALVLLFANNCNLTSHYFVAFVLLPYGLAVLPLAGLFLAHYTTRTCLLVLFCNGIVFYLALFRYWWLEFKKSSIGNCDQELRAKALEVLDWTSILWMMAGITSLLVVILEFSVYLVLGVPNDSSHIIQSELADLDGTFENRMRNDTRGGKQRPARFHMIPCK